MSRMQAVGVLLGSLACIAQIALGAFVFVAWAYGYEVWPTLNYPEFALTTLVACCGLGLAVMVVSYK